MTTATPTKGTAHVYEKWSSVPSSFWIGSYGLTGLGRVPIFIAASITNRADADLFADALNTYTATGLTPSELVEMLAECLPYVEEAEQFNKPMCRGLSKRITALTNAGGGK